jgi:signal transduction histidine kinase
MAFTEEESIMVMIFAGTLGMLILVAAIIVFSYIYQKRLIKQQLALHELKTKHQLDLLSTMMQTEEGERKRIAENLHDDAGTMMSIVKLNISRLERLTTDEPNQIAGETKTLVNDIILNIRRIIKDLVPQTLESFGLVESVKELCNSINSSNTIKVNFIQTGDYQKLPEKTELALFRVIQELLNNSLKHAGADQIRIRMDFVGNSYKIIVEDNGKGFDMNSTKLRRSGLKNIESRISIINGQIEFNSKLGVGTKATIVLKNQYQIN